LVTPISSFLVLTSSSIATFCTAADSLSSQSNGGTPASVFNYVLAPKDGHDKNACIKTEDFIKQVTQESSIYSYSSRKGKLLIWALTATDSQADTIREDEGVSDISPNVNVLIDNAAVSPLLPSDLANLSEAKKARGKGFIRAGASSAGVVGDPRGA